MVTPEGEVHARVHVVDGVIQAVEPLGDSRCADVAAAYARARVGGVSGPVIDLREVPLLPGLVDTHVHVNEPGRTHWEGFFTAGRAAIRGGVTTLVDMPLNSLPVTITPEALRTKVEAAGQSCCMDFAFWGGLIPGSERQLEPLARAGVAGFKCFLVDSGIEQFPAVDRDTLNLAGPILAALGLPLLVHAEHPDHLRPESPWLEREARRRYRSYESTRPSAAEAAAISWMSEWCHDTGCRVHIVHVSSREGLVAVAAARELNGDRFTAETCPHYLTFEATGVPDGDTTFKCAPPIRGGEDRDALWEALAAGRLDLVASDHSPCPPDLRGVEHGDFFDAWGGISSLDLSLSAVWTGAVERGHGLVDMARWMSEAPARLAGLEGCKGAIRPGYDADLVAFDPDVMWVVEGPRPTRHPETPYAGRELRGRVVSVWSRGEPLLLNERLNRDRAGTWVRPRPVASGAS